MNKYVLIILACSFFASCEQEIPLDLFVEKPIIYSNFHPDSSFQVWISKTSPPDHPFQINPAVKDAKISLYEEGKLLFNLPYLRHEESGQPGGSYYGVEHFAPKVGVEYELEVAMPGVAPAFTKSSIPRLPNTPTANILQVEYHERDHVITGLSVYLLEVDIVLNHAPETDEFFHLRAFSPILQYKLFEEDTVKNATGYFRMHELDNINTAYSNVEIINGQKGSILFKDDKMNNVPLHLRLTIEYDIFPDSELKSPIYFVLESRQEEEYLFWQSIQGTQTDNIDPFQYFTEPGIVYSNVVNGLGLFSGYNSTRFTIFF